MRNSRIRYLALVVGAAAVVTGGLVITGVLRPAGPAAPPAAGPVYHGGTGAPAGLRTVIINEAGTPALSQPNHPLQTLLKEGRLPAQATLATVLTDEDCTPDAQGISHCTNRLRLDGGEELVVTHPHRMADVPCLSPDERVFVELSA